MPCNVMFTIIICILLCLNFHYTFPLHRDVASKNWYFGNFYNNRKSVTEISAVPKLTTFTPSVFCGIWRALGTADKADTVNKKTCTPVEYNSLVDRQKKMSANFENTNVKKLKSSNFDKNIDEYKTIRQSNAQRNYTLNDEDIREYVQLVIMKKYPFLDMKDLDKYRPNLVKNPRQSIKLIKVDSNLRADQSLCEASEDGPNVEIFSRGLSGFSMPLLKNRLNMKDSKGKLNDFKYDLFDDTPQTPQQKSSQMNTLKDIIIQYEHKLHDIS